MARFFDAALSFPTALFTFLMLVVVGYWLVVLLSLADADTLDTLDTLDTFDASDVDGADAGSGLAAMLTAVGLGGVPATVVLTVLVALAWFGSLVGTALLDGLRGPATVRVALSVAVLPVALGVAWLGTRSMVVPLRRMLPDNAPPSRLDFVGRRCVVRTGEVGPEFGQAEVTAADGSTAIIQVRTTGETPAGAGWIGLIYDYDHDDETFWITPV